MQRVRTLLIGTAVVLGTAVAALLAGPSLVDWNQYRPEIARVLETATGRRVTIAGDVDLALLPKPVLSARTVTLALPDGTVLAEMREADLAVRLSGLLRGTVQIESLELDAPRMRVLVGEADGPVWPIDLSSLGGVVQLDRLSVEDATLVLQDRGRTRSWMIEAFTGAVDAGGPRGPFNLAGRFLLDGQPVQADLTGGRLVEGGPLPLRAELRLPEAHAISALGQKVSAGGR